MDKIRLGALGLADHFLRRVIRPALGSRTVSLDAVASRDLARARAAAAQFGFPKAYGSYEALLADGDIDAVYIPLPNHLHLEWIGKAALAGKQVLCEKPLALDARAAEEARAVCERAGVLLMEAFMYRYHPQWVEARRLVQSGEIGALREIRTTFSYHNEDPRNIRNIKEAGGGAIRDIGCYAVSVARFLSGAEPSRAVSLVKRDERFDTDVLSSAILDFGPFRSAFTVSTQAFPCQEVQVLGTGGRLRILVPFNMPNDVPASLELATGLGTRVIQTEAADQYGLMLDGFARGAAARMKGEASLREPPALWSGRESLDPADAVANQRVLDALFNSEKEGGWVAV